MTRWLPALVLLSLMALCLWGCEHDTSNGPVTPVVTDKTCLSCHSSEEELKLALGEEAASKVGTTFKSDG